MHFSQNKPSLLVVGGGIGGMAAAIGAALAGWTVHVYERASAFSELGAGVQLGPNAVRLLRGWGLGPGLERLAVQPEAIDARNSTTGERLATLPLGAHAIARYNAPYMTIHRADLLRLMMELAIARNDVFLHAEHEVQEIRNGDNGIFLRTQSLSRNPEGDNAVPAQTQGAALILADGIWSRLRTWVIPDEPLAPSAQPRSTGHLAWRAIVPFEAVPAALRQRRVTAWMGEKLHAIHYPIRRGELMNIVVATHGQPPSNIRDWDHSANAALVEAQLAHVCAELHELIHTVSATGAQWRLWPVFDRVPLRGAHEMARGRVALLGDTAHPMRPYLAQGAGMAIEDGAVLQRVLTEAGKAAHADPSAALTRYAQMRWARVSRVQARSIRNGKIFHATGLVRWARDVALRVAGGRLMDVPWLYSEDDAPAPMPSPHATSA